MTALYSMTNPIPGTIYQILTQFPGPNSYCEQTPLCHPHMPLTIVFQPTFVTKESLLSYSLSTHWTGQARVSYLTWPLCWYQFDSHHSTPQHSSRYSLSISPSITIVHFRFYSRGPWKFLMLDRIVCMFKIHLKEP